MDREELKGRLNELEYTFTHLHYDSFLVTLVRFDLQIRATFYTDPQGLLASFALPIESEEKPIIFKRIIPASASAATTEPATPSGAEHDQGVCSCSVFRV